MDEHRQTDKLNGKLSLEEKTATSCYVQRSSFQESRIVVYRRRWIMLALFVATSTANAIHWLQYSIIANVSIKYYDVTTSAVNWTSMIYMVIYVPLIFPATCIIEKKGLRFSLIAGTALMCLGAWAKLLTLNRDLFFVAFLAQGVIGGAQIFILSVPARLASIWFDAKEVSTACAIGILGNQLGVALGFVLPPTIVHDSNDLDKMREEFKLLYIMFAIPPTVLLVLLITFFEAAPPEPPSMAQVAVRENVIDHEAIEKTNSFKELFKNKDFNLLVVTYGINVGIYYAYSTLLNQLYLLHDENGEAMAGYIGLVMILGGMIGSVSLGIFLDKTHLFGSTTSVVVASTVVGLIGFTFSLHYEQTVFIFVSSGILGFFMNGFITVANEFTCEITYPVPESTSTGVLNAVGELVGLSMVLIFGMVLDKYHDLFTNLSMTLVLLFGFLISICISGKSLKRHIINSDPLYVT